MTYADFADAIGENNLAKVQKLIAAKADVDAIDPEDGYTPLHLAVLRNKLGIVKVLSKIPTMLNKQDNKGRTPFYLSIEKGSLETAQALIDAGADVNEADNDLKTPLHLAVEKGNLAIVQELIIANASLNKADKNEEVPLHLAIKNGNLDIVNALIKAGAALNEKDLHGRTPLHFAIRKNNLDIVNALIDASADIGVHDQTGNTAFFLAAQLKHTKIIEAFMAAEVRQNLENKPSQAVLSAIQHWEDYDEIIALLGGIPTKAASPTNNSSASIRARSTSSKINTIVTELSKEVDNFHPKHWYDNSFFRWIQSFFAPVRRMKDEVREFFKAELKAIAKGKGSEWEKENDINILIERFSKVQKYIEDKRQEKVAGQDVVASAQGYLKDPAVQTFNFDIAADKTFHKGVVKEESRRKVLIDKMDTIKKTYKQS